MRTDRPLCIWSAWGRTWGKWCLNWNPQQEKMHEPNKELRLPLMKNSRLMVRQIILVKFKKYSEISNILAWLRSVAWILEDNADLIEKQLFFYFFFLRFEKHIVLSEKIRHYRLTSDHVWGSHAKFGLMWETIQIIWGWYCFFSDIFTIFF